MEALAEKLDAKLRGWSPDTAARARQQVEELMELADGDFIDLMRSRSAEQEVLDLLDVPSVR